MNLASGLRPVVPSAPSLFALLALAMAACGSEEAAAPSRCVPRVAPANVPGLPGMPAAPTTELERVASFGDNPGALEMYVHAPPSGAAKAVVVALHGCTQRAADYTAAGWNELADELGLAIVYPEQTTANHASRCFTWFQPGDTARDGGEARSIAAMTEHAMKTYGASRAFVTGLSAGGAMTAVMLATYPELFEAGAIMAGIPYGCARSTLDAFSCMSGRTAGGAGSQSASVPPAAAYPRVSIWHGAADWTVRPANLDALVAQWTSAHGVASPTSTTKQGQATHREFRDLDGRVVVESWLVDGMGHGVPLGDGCGRAGAYFLDVGICSTRAAAAFFGLLGGGTKPGPSPGGAGAPPPDAPDEDCEPQP